eukprot:3839535-Prymnesium_polylepis.1
MKSSSSPGPPLPMAVPAWMCSARMVPRRTLTVCRTCASSLWRRQSVPSAVPRASHGPPMASELKRRDASSSESAGAVCDVTRGWPPIILTAKWTDEPSGAACRNASSPSTVGGAAAGGAAVERAGGNRVAGAGCGSRGIHSMARLPGTNMDEARRVSDGRCHT